MEKKRILIVTQEMKPYLLKSEISNITRLLPQHIQENGMDIRVLMPRFGYINERRHRLHEVVRLSGINIPVGEEDHPLRIKVASLPGARLQVYFLDNEDLFKRKGIFHDEEKGEIFFEDNDERMIFFCKGVIETIKKFGWPPHIIHCHGWMTSLVPYYLKTYYKTEPIFGNTKVVYSVYQQQFKDKLAASFMGKLKSDLDIKEADIFKAGDNDSLDIGAMTYADAVVKASPKLGKPILDLLKKNGKPILEYTNSEDEELDYAPFREFYDTLLNGGKH